MTQTPFIDHSMYLHDLKQTAKIVLQKIHDKYNLINRPLNFMHVCGTHEATVARSGIRSLLPKDLRIISGPGCPVCICPAEHIAIAKQLAREGNIVATFGDMLKVPDTSLSSLANVKTEGYDVRVVYSVRDAVKLAVEHPDKNIVWLGVGFETTAPMTAYEMLKTPPENFFVLTDFRLVPPALDLLLDDREQDLDGIIMPGHVLTITGTNPFDNYPEKYKIPFVVAGFEAVEFLYAIDLMLKQIIEHRHQQENAYPKVVKPEGNIKAKEVLAQVFDTVDAKWRGIGEIPQSGYELKSDFAAHNARTLLQTEINLEYDLPKGCRCGKVILGKVEPEECPHFLKKCTPETPVGPCMVSDEGTCRIRATYRSV